MNLELFTLSLLNGISYGLLLFLLSAGLTLIFGMMRILNLAHGSFYMLGAYLGYTSTCVLHLNFWATLLVVPCVVGLLGMAAQRYVICRVSSRGHLAELLLTYGMALLVLAIVQLVWGKAPLEYVIPQGLQGAAFEIFGVHFPRYRAAIMLIAIAALVILFIVLRLTPVGMMMRAATQNAQMLESLGYNVPGLMTVLFGLGCALAALAGMLGGFAYVTEPAMAQSMGMLLFVVVIVGGLGALGGAFLASLFLGVLQTFLVGMDASLADIFGISGVAYDSVLYISISQFAPLLPFVLMAMVLLVRPQGLLGEKFEVRR